MYFFYHVFPSTRDSDKIQKINKTAFPQFILLEFAFQFHPAHASPFGPVLMTLGWRCW
jgi:hypothetical protein